LIETKPERNLEIPGVSFPLGKQKQAVRLPGPFPFNIGKPQLRPPRCDTRVTPEEKRRFLARRAQETEQRRALFNAETDAETT